MAGFDPRDSTSVEQAGAGLRGRASSSRSAGLKIGLLKEFFDKGLDPANERCIREALAVYEKLGAQLIEVSLPNLPLSVPAYYVVAPGRVLLEPGALRRRALRPSLRGAAAICMDLYKRSRGEGFGAEVKRRIMTGTYVLSAGYYDAYYLKAQKVRQLIAENSTSAFARSTC